MTEDSNTVVVVVVVVVPPQQKEKIKYNLKKEGCPQTMFTYEEYHVMLSVTGVVLIHNANDVCANIN